VAVAAVVLAASLLSWGTPGAQAVKTLCGIQIGHSCVTLTINLTGNGTGRFQSVTSAPAPDGLIDCWRSGGITYGTCSASYDVVTGGSHVMNYLQESAAGSNTCFLDCHFGPYPVEGQISVAGNMTDSDFWFTLVDPVTVSFARVGTGSGTVTLKEGVAQAIACGSSCHVEFPSGYPVTITATAAKGSVFSGWSNGPCSGTAATCTFTPTAATAVAAAFDTVAKPTSAPAGSRTPGSTPSSTSSLEVVAAASVEATTSAEPTVTAEPTVSAAPPSPTSSAAPVASDPASSGTDLTPIGIAIVIATLLIAAALVLVFGILPRRIKPPV
jgi:hypothetical protein